MIYNIFYILLPEQNKTRKLQVDKNIRRIDFDPSNKKSKKYKIEVI